MMLPGIVAAEGAHEARPTPIGKLGRRAEMEPPNTGFPALLFGILTPPVPVPPSAAAPPEDEALAAGGEAAGIMAAAVASANPSAADRSLANVDPVFRVRLERVMERMQQEFGHRVEITETVRSQARQEHLYAQGRSRPGPVVTWTLDSNHKTGRAADVVIDGSYGNPTAYQRLAGIAAEEGLRTLGPNDPGHIELPKEFASSAQASGQMIGGRQTSPAVDAGYASEGSALGRHGIAHVAAVARVAHIAEVARVAPVAHAAEAAPAAASAQAAGARAEGDADGESMSGDGNNPPSRAAEAGMARSASGFAPGGAFASAMIEGLNAPGGADPVGRLARILEMKDGAPSAPVDHMVLRLDNGTGGEDRIRVDLRGSGLGATIDAGSAADAERLLSRLPELKQALERHGLDTEALKIRSAALAAREATLTVDAARSVVRPDGSAESALGRDRGKHSGRDEAGEGTGNSHSRSRKEQNGDQAS